MNRRRFVHVAAPSLSLAAFVRRGGGQPDSPAPAGARTVMDMVHFNPGEKPPTSRFLDPKFLASWKYNSLRSKAFLLSTRSTRPLVPPHTPERAWSEAAATAIQGRVQAAHAAGLKGYAWIQLVVFPNAVVE